MSDLTALEKANKRIKSLELALSDLIFDAEQVYNVGFLNESLQWIPKESVIDALEVRVDITKSLLEDK